MHAFLSLVLIKVLPLLASSVIKGDRLGHLGHQARWGK